MSSIAPDPHTLERDLMASAFDALPVALLVCDAEGRVVAANREGAGRCSVSDPVGSAVLEVLPRAMHRPVRRCMERAARTGEACSLMSADDAGEPVEVSATPSGGGVTVQVRNVWAQQAALRDVRADRDRAWALLDGMNAGLLVTALDGEVTAANRRFLDMTGLDSEGVVGLRPPHPWWGPGQEAVEATLRANARAGRVGNLEAVMQATSGRRFPVRIAVGPLRDDSGEPVGMVTTFADITDEHLARQRLRRSEAEFRLLAEQSSDLICRHDEDGSLRYVSPSSRTVLGRAPFGVRGSRLQDFVDPEDRGALDAAFAAVMEDGSDRTVVVRAPGQGGAGAWLETTLRRVAAAGAPGQVISTTRDVTDRHLGQLEDAAVARVTDAVGAGVGVEAVARLLVDDLAEVLMCDEVALWRLDEGTAAAVAVRTADPHAPRNMPVIALRAGQRDPVAEVVGFGSGACVGEPIVVDGRCWGVLVACAGERPLDAHARARLTRFAGVAATLVHRARASAALTLRAERDPLTGLANRAVFDDALEGAARRGEPLALCVVDIDRFKDVNDTHGHDMGDAVLREMARMLRDLARRGDLVARIGGEEFGWVMPATGLQEAVVAADRAREVVASSPIPGIGTVTVSMGLTEVGGGDWDPAEVFRTADRALYAAKGAGRDRVVGLPRS